MKTFEIEYNGETSKFNAYENGYSMTGRKITSRSYSVRPSKSNTMKIYMFVEVYNEDGTTTYHFFAHRKFERGHKVNATIVK